MNVPLPLLAASLALWLLLAGIATAAYFLGSGL